MTETNHNIMDWWWIRHMPTGFSDRFCGSTDIDPPLNDTAIRSLRADLPEANVWLSSPLRRCRKTAAALTAEMGKKISISVHSAFREQDFGAWEGVAYDQPAVRNNTEFWANPADVAPPDGESFAELTMRVQHEIKSLNSARCGTIVAVAHAGTIRAALSLALSIPPAKALNFQIDPLSITRLSWIADIGSGGAWRICCVNRQASAPVS